MKNFAFLFFLFGFFVFTNHAQAQSFSQLEREILSEINRVRRDPAAYAKWIEDNRANLPYTPQPKRLKVIDEAVRELRKSPALPVLTVSRIARSSAKAHLNDQLPTGKFSHNGADGSSVDRRLRRFGILTGAYGENAIAMNPEDPVTAARLVLVWVIDDTIRGRGHRKLLLDANYRVAGIACGKYANSGIFPDHTLCVADFAAQLQ